MKINLKNVMYILFLLPYFATTVFMSEKFIVLTRIISFLVFIFYFFIYLSKKKKLDFNEILIIGITLWIYLISILNRTLTVETAYLTYSWFAVCMLAYNSFDDDFNFVNSFGLLLNLYVLLNIPFLLKGIGVDAYERIFIFGGKNAMQMYFIPAIFINYYLSYVKHNKLKKEYLIFIILDIITIFACGASTGIIAVILFLLFSILNKKLKVTFKTYSIIILISLFLIFNTDFIMKIDFLYDFIVNVLHKDLTFTARTKIWDYVIPQIINNPLGFGYGNNVVNSNFYWLNEAHNMYLELFLIGGIPLITMYLMLIYNLLKKNMNKISNSLLVMCFSFFVVGLTESVQFHLQFWIVIIAYYKLTNKKKEESYEKE